MMFKVAVAPVHQLFSLRRWPRNARPRTTRMSCECRRGYCHLAAVSAADAAAAAAGKAVFKRLVSKHMYISMMLIFMYHLARLYPTLALYS